MTADSSVMRRIARVAGIAALKLMHRGVQLQFKELTPIARAIQTRPGCKLLVFGVGNDSSFWININTGGRTVFLEDDAQWLNKAKKKLPSLEAYQVEYETKMSDWRSCFNQPDRLTMDLPDAIKGIAWDVILVDAPAGYADFIKLYGVEAPGRMKSIFTASQLVRDGGSVFVHDCEREIEREFSDKYLLAKNCVAEIKGRAVLRHYVMHR